MRSSSLSVHYTFIAEDNQDGFAFVYDLLCAYLQISVRAAPAGNASLIGRQWSSHRWANPVRYCNIKSSGRRERSRRHPATGRVESILRVPSSAQYKKGYPKRDNPFYGAVKQSKSEPSLPSGNARCATEFVTYCLQMLSGAADGTRTRTVSLPGDFKSPVSTDSTTAAA